MPTLAALHDAVIREADVQGIVDPADLTALLNEELSELYELIVEAFENHYAASTPLTITAGNSSVAIPAAVFKVLDLEDDSDPPVSLKRFAFNDRNRTSSLSYVIHGSNILVRPEDSAPGTYTLHYVPIWTDLANDADTFTAPNNWHLYAVFGAAQRLKETQDLDGSALGKRKQALRERIETAAKGRNAGVSQQVRDVRTRRRWDDPDQREFG